MRMYYFAFLFAVASLFSIADASAQCTFSKEYDGITIRHLCSYEQSDGYLTVGNSTGSNSKVRMIKTDFEGNTLWTKWLCEGSASFVNTQDENGNIFILLGNSIMKFSPQGNVVWNHTYTKSIRPAIYKNGFLWAVYYTEDWDYYLSKIDATNGQEISQFLIGEKATNVSEWYITSIAVKDDEEISITSWEQSWRDSFGSRLFKKSVGSDIFTAFELDIVDPENSTYVSSIKYVGDELWGITNSQHWSDTLYFVLMNTNGNINAQLPVYLGETQELTINDFAVSADQNAVLLCEKYYGYPNEESLLYFLSPDDSINSMLVLPTPDLSRILLCTDEGYLISGTAILYGNPGHPSNLYLHKTDSLGLLTAVPSIVSLQTAHAYPNPASGVVTISIEKMKDDIVTMYDTFGRLITHLKLQNGIARWDASDEKSGVYFYLVNGETGKVIIK